MTQAIVPAREMSLAELDRRIDLNVKSGWGLQTGSVSQLNLLALYCQKHQLLPGDDVTLYEGRPWITIDGRVKLMRRHTDEYRGYSTRPLSKEEKETWGYDPDDLVIEATIRTETYGEIKARGRVSKAERDGTFVKGVRHNPVAQHHPIEMAEKRALSRAERYTFGTDSVVDDEDVDASARLVIEERNDPAAVAALAAKHEAIFGKDEDHAFAEPPKATAEIEDEPDEGAFRCTECLKVIRDQAGQPINETQVAIVIERYNKLLCRTCRAIPVQ